MAIIVSEDGCALLSKDATAKNFLTDAYSHCKFIGYNADALPLFDKAGLADCLDAGCIELGSKRSISDFTDACRQLRYWVREVTVDLDG